LEQAYQADKTNWEKKSIPVTPVNKLPTSPVKENSLKKRKRSIDNNTAPSKPVILFSNFKENSDYDLSRKDRLEKITKKLGADIAQNVEDPKVTHVICPPNSRTYKTLAAHILCLWVVTAEWLEESDKENKFLPEHSFGNKRLTNPLKGKTFFVTAQFKAEPKNKDKIEYLEKLVVHLGKGRIVDNFQNADYALILADDNPTDYRPADSIPWNNFLAIIIPEDKAIIAEIPGLISKVTPKKKRSINNTEYDSPDTETKDKTTTKPKKKSRKSSKK